MLKEFLEFALALACQSPFSRRLSIFRSPCSRLLSRPVGCQHFPQKVCVNARALRTNLDTVLTRLRTRLVIIEAALRVLPTGNSSNNNTLVGCWHVGVCRQIRVDSPPILCLGGSKAKFGRWHHNEDRGPQTWYWASSQQCGPCSGNSDTFGGRRLPCCIRARDKRLKIIYVKYICQGQLTSPLLIIHLYKIDLLIKTPVCSAV